MEICDKLICVTGFAKKALIKTYKLKKEFIEVIYNGVGCPTDNIKNPTIENIKNTTIEQLTEIHEIGERIASSVVEYFKNEINLKIVDKLKISGIQLEINEELEGKAENKLNGQTFVISGTFEKHSRDELKELISKFGGKNTGSISAKTNYLLAGENIGPSKLEKVKKLNIPIISEEEFINNTKRYSARIAGVNLPRIYQSQIVHSDGSTIDVELNVCVVPYGRSLAALVIVRDIREEEAWKYSV